MNRLFKRQLGRHFGKEFNVESLEPKMKEFFLNIAQTYEEYDSEKRLLENTLDLNSRELFAANKEIGTQLRQYKQAMDSALLVNTFNLEGILTFANSNFCKISALSADEMVGQNYKKILAQGNSEHVVDELFSTLLKREIYNGELKYQNAHQETYVLKATIFPILNTNDEVTEYMSIFQDITEIENSRQKALELDRAKSLFIANMSHELRTPLNSIIGFSQIMQRKNELPEKHQSYIEKINQSGEHLLKLINSILDFSKIESGEVNLEAVKINLYSLIKTALSQQEQNAQEKHLKTSIFYDENLGQLFIGDSVRISQILINLIANAIKFTSSGSILIVAKKVGHNRVRIKVQDTGIGLDEEEKLRLFKEFSQADNSTTRKYGGTGLGLSISKKLVELMNGTIWIESVKGEGSSFIFEIDLIEVS